MILYLQNAFYLRDVSSIRQNKMEALIKKELSNIFLRNGSVFTKGALVSVTVVRISPDLSFAKCYLSIFSKEPKEDALQFILLNANKIKKELGRSMRNIKKTPEIAFFIDDSLDYSENIDNLLKK